MVESLVDDIVLRGKKKITRGGTDEWEDTLKGVQVCCCGMAFKTA